MFLTSLIILVFLLISCKTTEYIDRYNTNTQYITKYDSIFIENITKDSIYIYKSGDTIFVNKYTSIYKDRFKYKYDTIVKRDSLYFKQKEIINKTDYKGWYWFGGLLLIIIFYIIYKLKK